MYNVSQSIAYSVTGNYTLIMNQLIITKTRKFFLQIALFLFVVAMILLAVLQLTPNILSAIGASALVTSTFIIFTVPNTPSAKPFCIFSAYVFALLVGIISAHFMNLTIAHFDLSLISTWQVLFGIVSVILTVCLMLLFNVHHPPAVGLSLGLVLDDWTHAIVIFIFVGVLVIVFFRLCFGGILMTLIDREQ